MGMPTTAQAAEELLRRRRARSGLADYISFVKKRYVRSWFSDTVCAALDQFIERVKAGERPVLVLQAPPQHGKSDIVSRHLPPYLLARNPEWRVGACSYNDDLARSMAQDVRRVLGGDEHKRLFPMPPGTRYSVDRADEITAPGGLGSYIAKGVGSGLTGRPLDIGIIDDPIKNDKDALSPTIKEGHWNWYQSVFNTRMSECSGQIVMATSWAEDDLPGRIIKHFAGDPRLMVLRFPAINDPTEAGYNPEMPVGALVPKLHSANKLRETKALLSDYWWSAMYQQSPRSLGGNVFKEHGIRYYTKLPDKFDKVLTSWDCTFKDTDGSDYVVGQVWGKVGPDVYLIHQERARMSFSDTLHAVRRVKMAFRQAKEHLIEDKANGPAVIDTLKREIAGIIPIEPDGSKLARAHAVTSYWEAGNVWLPTPEVAPWVKEFTGEVTTFPAAANDDQVDAMSQALRRLYPARGIIKISQAAIARARSGAKG